MNIHDLVVMLPVIIPSWITAILLFMCYKRMPKESTVRFGVPVPNDTMNIMTFDILKDGKDTGRTTVKGSSNYHIALNSPGYSLRNTKTKEVIEGFQFQTKR